MKGFQRLFLLLSGIVVGVMVPMAKEKDVYRFSCSLYGGLYLTRQAAWMLEADFKWNFHKYIGIGAGIELTGQYNQPCESTFIDGHLSEIVDNERNIYWCIFKPKLTLRTPTLWRTSDNYCRLWLEGVPGISLACPFRNSLTYQVLGFQGNIGHVIDYRRFANDGLQWFYWNASASLNLSIDRFIISASYGISNLDYYSCRRYITLPDGSKPYAPEKELSQSVFLSLSYCF